MEVMNGTVHWLEVRERLSSLCAGSGASPTEPVRKEVEEVSIGGKKMRVRARQGVAGTWRVVVGARRVFSVWTQCRSGVGEGGRRLDGSFDFAGDPYVGEAYGSKGSA